MSTIALDQPPTFDIPDLWCPFPARVHPEAAGVDDRLLEWVRERDLVRSEATAHRFRSAGFGSFAAEAYPGAVQLDLVAQWNGFNWIVDDQFDEGHREVTHEERVRIARELLGQLTPGLHAPRPTGPLTAALADLWRRTAKPMSPAWRKRYLAHYRDWLGFTLLPHAREGRIPEQAAPGPASSPALFTFIRRRHLESGCELSFDLLEPGNLSEVPEQVADCDAVRDLRAAANDAISWHNDLFSITKELARGDHHHLAAVLRRANRSSWEEAIAAGAGMIEDATRDFQAACQDVRFMRPLFDLDDEEWARADRWLTELGEWIAGSLHWHAGSLRYRIVEATPDGRTPSYIEPHLF